MVSRGTAQPTAARPAAAEAGRALRPGAPETSVLQSWQISIFAESATWQLSQAAHWQEKSLMHFEQLSFQGAEPAGSTPHW